MKKLLVTSVLLLQMATQLSHAELHDTILKGLGDSFVSASYTLSFIEDQGLGKTSDFNHGASLGLHYPISDVGKLGLEIEVSRPKMLFLDRADTVADMTVSALAYSGVLKLQREFPFSNNFGIVGSAGAGATYVTFDSVADIEGRKLFKTRQVDSKLNMTFAADLSAYLKVTEHVSCYAGYSLRLSPEAEIVFHVTSPTNIAKETTGKAKESTGKANVLPIVSHALRAGITIPLQKI